MSSLSILYSIFYTIILGGFFVYVFILLNDLFYGEKQQKQIKKIQKYFRHETIKQIDFVEHLPKQYTRYNVVTSTGTQTIKMMPGYKVVKIVAKKKDSEKTGKWNLFSKK